MGVRERKKQERRARIENEALSVFVEHGYDAASIEQVVAASDIARGTFYLYFPDKLSVFETLVDRWYLPTAEILGAVSKSLDNASTREDSFDVYMDMAVQLATVSLQFGDELKVSFAEMRRSGEAGERLRARQRHLQGLGIEFTEKAAERGLITAPNSALVSIIIFGAVEKLMWMFLTGEELPGTPIEVATQAMAMFSRALDLPLPDLG